MKKSKLLEIRIKYYCPKLDKEMESKVENDFSFDSVSSECDMCGSHGKTSVNIFCKCGQVHDFELTSW